ncbi:MAG TPA: translation elongation factor Ts [Candidatus Kapabacteria bacterium]|nr:translation elongation factor Ts [Candidatus Kapabacteria bacterium]
MAISAAEVKKLRDKTGVGMADCKKALEEAGGDEARAIEILRKHGEAISAKRADKIANQGLVEAYIHTGGKMGSLIELNCETDFVAKTESFQVLARDLAMQIVAMQPLYVSKESVPPEIIASELDIARQTAINEGKPENMLDRIAQGRLEKFYQEVCLLEQTYIKDGGKTIRDILNEATAKLGEKIDVRRFSRFQLGESH